MKSKPKSKNNISVRVEPLLVGAEVAAKMCGVSKRYWLQLDNQGKIPQPIHLGKRRLWGVEGLREWISKGCPSR